VVALHLNLALLVGLVALRPGFSPGARRAWTLALAIQVWHHFEHALLLFQATTDNNLFGAEVPTSVVQLVAPRVELHLFYNTVVLVPMLVALYREFIVSTRLVPEGPQAWGVPGR